MRTWLDYGAIQVTDGYGQTKQLPHKQADVSVQNTPTPRINTETARSGRPARPSLPGEPTCWTANLRILTSAAMIVAFEGKRGRLQTGEETGLDWVWPYVLTYNKGSLFILSGFQLSVELNQ